MTPTPEQVLACRRSSLLIRRGEMGSATRLNYTAAHQCYWWQIW